jgi:hypothetical protein
VHHCMVVYRSLEDVSFPHRLFDEGLARASAVSYMGELKGFVMISAPTGGEVSTRSGPACPGTVGDCIDLVVDMFKDITSDHMPGDCIVFGLLTLEVGTRRKWENHVLQLPGVDGVRDAAGHAFGSPEAHAVVEVVGDDPHDVLQRLLALTDLPYVTRLETMHVAIDDVRGFGSGAARNE